MIFNMTGGASLNFKVVPGLTQPGTAAENTIWVKTETIGAWYFAPTQPEGMQPTDVWFLTGTNSDLKFNALKKNEILIRPIESKQMTDGGLVSVEVSIYQNGAWTELDTKKYVFKSGKGALENISKATAADRYYVTIGTERIEGHGYDNSSAADYVSFYTARKDLTGYNTLYFDVQVTEAWSGEEPRFGVASSTIPATGSGASKFTAYAVVKKGNRQTISVDISNKDGGYIGAWGVGNFYVYNIWYK
jgi:hypothetical protein